LNSEQFVEALKRHVRDAAIADTIAMLKDPPGRRVQSRQRKQSDWYNGLSAEGADHVNGAIAEAAHAALFGILAVIDGARKIDNEGGRFELIYVENQPVVLNDRDSIGLHDLLNAPN
jgi:hypothetical protein